MRANNLLILGVVLLVIIVVASVAYELIIQPADRIEAISNTVILVSGSSITEPHIASTRYGRQFVAILTLFAALFWSTVVGMIVRDITM